MSTPVANNPAPTAPPGKTGSAVPSGEGEIKVSAMSTSGRAPVAQPAAAAPKTESATSKMISDLRGRARAADSSQNAPAPKPGDKKPEPAAAAPGAEEDQVDGAPAAENPDEGDEGLDNTTPQAAPKSGAATDKKKVNPWKLAEEYKAKAAQKDAEVAELRRLMGDPEGRKSEVARLEAVQKRNEELEKHIRFVDYSKSTEFTEKYEKPYEQKWAQTMSELKDVIITDAESGQERGMKPQDMLQLVNMPLNKAMEMAKELYGDSASIIMGYRKELRDLYGAKSAALEKARTDGAAQIKQQQELTQKQQQELSAFAESEWKRANESITTNEATGHYFKPIDGDTEGNTRLEKGYKFVDEVMAMSPFDPKLSAEDRAKVVSKHAAVRARAAAFGRVRHMLELERSEHEKTREKLKQYESSEPDVSGQAPASGGGGAPEKASTSVMGALRKLAK